MSVCALVGLLVSPAAAHAAQTPSEQALVTSVTRAAAPEGALRQFYSAPRPRYRFGTLETHRWVNSWLPQSERINRTTAARVAAYANAAVSNYLRALAASSSRAALVDRWSGVARCESGGNWAINTGNGYYGGLQFSLSTWRGYGGSGYPHQHPAWVQATIADRVRVGPQGLGAWPHCGRLYG